ncbi:hypothetical protein IHV10_22250 [Fictibacillus sp. 5RED26]|uniref:hypothetical protein n=1 Tax=Fictibacillus sp. 5RED26 TaxID=2745876 RepID=UPI0018CE3560|nr:hypothetical protein [Fictibacillus sp. 5RED26]MBH0159095.1 hypothetical protein [Fictibacillus sp. 5RED26]
MSINSARMIANDNSLNSANVPRKSLIPFDPQQVDKLLMPKNHSRIVTSDEYVKMSNTKNYTNSKKEQQAMKLKLVDIVKNAYEKNDPDKWYRLSKETRKTIDRWAFLAAEKGFSFASAEALAKSYGVHPKTVQNVWKFLKDAGVIYILNFRAKNGNGRRGTITLFMAHPYFEQWANLLNLKFVLPQDCEQDCGQENVQTPCLPKVEEGEKNSTISLPSSFKQEITINNDFAKIVKYVSLKLKDNPKKITHYSSYINRVMNDLHTQALCTDPETLKLQKEYRERLRNNTLERQKTVPKRPVGYDWVNTGA